MTAMTSQSPELNVLTKSTQPTIASPSSIPAMTAGSNSPFHGKRRKLPLRTVTDPTRPSQITDSQEDYEDRVALPLSPTRRLPLIVGTPEGVKDSSVRRDIHRPSYSIASRLGAASPSTFDISTHSIIPDHMKQAVCNSPLTPRSEARRVRFLDLESPSAAMDLTRSLANTARESRTSVPASDDDEITNQDQDNPFDVGEPSTSNWSLLADIAPFNEEEETIIEKTEPYSPIDKIGLLFQERDKISPALQVSGNEQSVENDNEADPVTQATDDQATALSEERDSRSLDSSEKDESDLGSSSSGNSNNDSGSDGSDRSNSDSGDDGDPIVGQQQNVDAAMTAIPAVPEACEPITASVLQPVITDINVSIAVAVTASKKPVSVPADVWKMNAVPSRARQPSKENERWVERPINALCSAKRKSATSPSWSVKRLNANNNKGRVDARQIR